MGTASQVRDFLPEHLLPYVVEQKPELYTAIDHASWRYIMRISFDFFKDHAHQIYHDGLAETGISIEHIPLISEMDEKLKKWGWRVVAVSGFIPPAVFLEFQALGILAIACDMRKHDHIAYTPAPDIVHEAAGHAPIVADAGYRAYLKAYGEVARKAIFSKSDLEIYEAVRILSDVKEDTTSSEAQIAEAQLHLDEAVASSHIVSEANQITRMAWWTTEYGLIGNLENPKVYGAGLLSSIGESFHCFDAEVKKVPFTLDCINVSYDITKPQPQLFVAPNFEVLTSELMNFSESMAFKQGGVRGLSKALLAETITTSQLDSGVEVSGVLEKFFTNDENEPIFLKFSGPVQLAFQEKEIENQGPKHHAQGFSSPIGKLKEFQKSAALLTENDLKKAGFVSGKKGKLSFESGIELEGVFTGSVRKNEMNLILTFKECTVSRIQNGTREILFDPSWGVYDLACGESIVSVYGNPADRAAYSKGTGGLKLSELKQKTNSTLETKKLEGYYQELRDVREEAKATGSFTKPHHEKISALLFKCDREYPTDWLLHLEVLELPLSIELKNTVLKKCEQLKTVSKEHRELITRGLAILKKERRIS